MAPLRSDHGQSTLEYLGVLTLVTAVLLLAAPLVGAPDIPQAVAGTIRHGICVVAGDVCTTADARASGLGPCIVDGREKGTTWKPYASVWYLSWSNGVEVIRASDGTYTVVQHHREAGGAEGEVSYGGRGGIDASGEVSAGLQDADATAYRFADAAALRRFMALSPAERSRARVPAAWTSYASGARAGAKVTLAFKGVTVAGDKTITSDTIADLASGEVEGVATRGTQMGPGAEITVTGTLKLRASGTARLVGRHDLGANAWSLALTTVGGERTRLVLRRETETDAGSRVSEDTATLDLRDPVDAAAAAALLHASPRDMRTALDAALARATVQGRREVAVYAVDDDSSHLDLGITTRTWKIGAQRTKTSIARHLVGATVKDGSPAGRERYDCLSAAADGAPTITP